MTTCPAALFPNGRQVLVASSFQVTAIGDEDGYASQIVQRFVNNLDAGDTPCAARIKEVRTVPKFVDWESRFQRGLAGCICAAFSAAAVIARWWKNLSGSGVRLRGGIFRYGYEAGTGCVSYD